MSGRIDALASQVLAQFEIPQDPPVDIEALAMKMGVSSITDSDLIEDGHLEYDPDRIQIRVRCGLSHQRRRFTIAHEVAHLLFLAPGTAGTVRRERFSFNNEERLCDEIAAALLLPIDWVSEHYSERPHNLSTIRHLAQQSQTSLSASVVRLQRVLSWTESLLRWRYDRSKWRFIGGSSIPTALHGQIRSAPNTSHVLDLIPRRTDVRTMIPVLIGERSVELQTHVSIDRSYALALTELPTARSHED
jgi:hypothetical protein